MGRAIYTNFLNQQSTSVRAYQEVSYYKAHSLILFFLRAHLISLDTVAVTTLFQLHFRQE